MASALSIDSISPRPLARPITLTDVANASASIAVAAITVTLVNPPALAVVAGLMITSAPIGAGLNASHRIEIVLLPEENRLKATDTMDVEANGQNELSFRLADHMTDLTVSVGGSDIEFEFKRSLQVAQFQENLLVGGSPTCQVELVMDPVVASLHVYGEAAEQSDIAP